MLIVEDDEALRNELASRLMEDGYQVVTAADGQEALEAVHRWRPAVAVVDVMLPKMSGAEFAAAVRQDPAIAELPMLFITAAGNLRRAPGGPLFLKPLNLDSLLRAVMLHTR